MYYYSRRHFPISERLVKILASGIYNMRLFTIVIVTVVNIVTCDWYNVMGKYCSKDGKVLFSARSLIYKVQFINM